MSRISVASVLFVASMTLVEAPAKADVLAAFAGPSCSEDPLLITLTPNSAGQMQCGVISGSYGGYVRSVSVNGTCFNLNQPVTCVSNNLAAKRRRTAVPVQVDAASDD